MTNKNHRLLARARNAFLGATALAGLWAATTVPASAIVVNDNNTPASAVDPNNVTGVGQMVVDFQNGFIGLCTASLINPRTVIFASHCVNENFNEDAFVSGSAYGTEFGGIPIGFFFNSNNNQAGNSAIGQWLHDGYATNTANNTYNANFVVYNPDATSLGLGLNFLQSDVAMASLDTPAVGIPTWTLLFSPLSAPVHATIEGYGRTGTGTNGDNLGIDFRRRVAENIVSFLGSLDDQDLFLFGPPPDGLPANLYMLDFNDPKFGTAQANQFDFNIFHDQATPNEGITAPGDSGGPLIVDTTFNIPVIAAVLSGGDSFFNGQPQSSYGTTSFYQPLYLYWDWIVANSPYKYVGAKPGNGSWTDPTHWVMNLDPNFVTIDANGNLVNALPTTPAQGSADVPPGFGQVCFFSDCQDITTGVETNPAPPAPPNPTGATNNGGPAVVSTAALGISSDPATLSSGVVSDPAVVQGGSQTNPSIVMSPAPASPPEGSAMVGGELVQGAPGSSDFVPNDTDGNPAIGAPPRYYDVTLAAAGTTTLSNASIVIDRLTIDGPQAGLTIASDGVLATLIDTTVWSGNFEVDGAYLSVGDIALMGGVLSGTGKVYTTDVTAVLGAIAPGTVGTVGTLTVNGNVILSSGSGLLIDKSPTSNDLLNVNGILNAGGSVVLSGTGGYVPEMGDSGVFAKAAAITGAFGPTPDTIPGVLRPTVSVINTPAGGEAVFTIVADTFVSQIPNGTADQLQVAAGLDAARGAHYNDMFALFQAIDPLSVGPLGQALENLAPDAQRAAPLVGDMQISGFDNMLWQHLGDVGGPGGGSMQAGLHVDTDGLRMALSSVSGTSVQSQQLLSIGQSIASNPGGGNDPIPTGAPVAPNQADSSGMMAMMPAGTSAFLSGSSLDGSVAIGGGGGRADVRGFIVGGGLDAPILEDLTVGMSFAYSDATTTLRAMPAMVQTNSVQAALYGRYDFDGDWISEAFLAYGHQTIETRRIAVVGGTAFGLSGHTGGDVPSFGAYLGKSFTTNPFGWPTLTLIPSFSLQYVSSNIDGYTESGGPAAMTFADYGEGTTLGRIGLDGHMTFDIGDVHATPNLHLAWINIFNGANDSIQAAFAAAPTAIMTFAQATRNSSYGEIGAGTDFNLGDVMGTQATLSARYDATIARGDITYGAWTGRLSIKF